MAKKPRKPSKTTKASIKSQPKKKVASKKKDDCPDGVCPIRESNPPQSLSMGSRFLNFLFPSRTK